MEESEKRRERLRAIRTEAAQSEVCNAAEAFRVPNSLSNPLAENSSAQSAQEQPSASSRFGFYTDPMAAFSANKKRGQHDDNIRQDFSIPPHSSAPAMARPSSLIPEPRISGVSPAPAHQFQERSSFDNSMYQAQGPYDNPHPCGGPRGSNPFPMHQGTLAPEAWNGSQVMSGHYRSPRGRARHFPMIHQGIPESWNGYGGAATHSSPYNASGGGQYLGPSFGPVRSPSFDNGQGRPQWQGRFPNRGSGRGTSPGPNAGRGRGRWYGSSMGPGLGCSGGRGRGLNSHGVGAERRQGPECFYNKSMDDDPWKQMEPLLWKSRSLNSPGCSNSWLPRSISTKKPKVSEAPSQSSSQPSLAEYLAASFNEATNDAPSS